MSLVLVKVRDKRDHTHQEGSSGDHHQAPSCLVQCSSRCCNPSANTIRFSDAGEGPSLQLLLVQDSRAAPEPVSCAIGQIQWGHTACGGRW
jgi:hypothetical protein